MRRHEVRYLLMGGQACVLYGGAEFSRDADIAVLTTPENLARLSGALDALGAEAIAVPAFDRTFLERGHAVHFRCHHPDAAGVRVDVMAVMRGVAPFDELWNRRTTITDLEGEEYDLLALADLVASKKTQRDKDWPMIRRLVEANYYQHPHDPGTALLDFWLRELRTPAILIDLVARFGAEARALVPTRPLLREALAGDEAGVASGLSDEEARERAADREYWRPLRAELEQLRREARR